MAEVFGAIQRALGAILSGIYEVIPSYGVAIVLLTIIVRIVLIPLTIKQIRSMTAMTKLQPELKRLQQRHKGDRQKMNEELMKLYKEHGVNPLGGCLPLLMQAPVFIALYSVLRASIGITAAATLAGSGTPATTTAFTSDDLSGKSTVVCRPAFEPSPGGSNPRTINCVSDSGPKGSFDLSDFKDARSGLPRSEVSWISACRPRVSAQDASKVIFVCQSALGTGHLPVGGDLFADVTRDQATFLGMHLGCTATQSNSGNQIRQCTSRESDAGGVRVVPYYLLIALFIGSTYYQSKQMASRATGQAAQQQKMMTRIMPVFLGFISLSIPAGVNVYWLVSNLWTIGQQTLILRTVGPPPGDGAGGPPGPKGGKGPGGKGAARQLPSGPDKKGGR